MAGESGAAPVGRPTVWEVTGNHVLAFPCVSTTDGSVHRVNVLHRGALGLLEWAASDDPETAGETPLFGPRIRVDGEPAVPERLESMRLDHWIPRFRGRPHPDILAEYTLFAPGGAGVWFPGAVYSIELENRGTEERTVDVALEGHWRWSLRTVATSRPLDSPNHVSGVEGGEGVALELGGEPGLAALAIVADDEASAAVGGEGAPRLGAIADGDTLSAPNGKALRFSVGRQVRLAPGERVSASFFLAVAQERDGAVAHARALRRIGAAETLQMARLELARMSRRVRQPKRAALLNRNLLYSVFFGAGRAIDDDRLYPVVSRSPLTAGGASVRERDTLLWILPALALADAPLARDLVLRCFELYSHRPGTTVHYLGGGALAPGFTLAGFCAYILALDHLVRTTGDETILDEPVIIEAILDLDDMILDRLHPRYLLAATDVLASGDEAIHPYVTYDNVLFWAFCRALERVWPNGETVSRVKDAAEEVESTIWRHAIAEIDGLRVLAGSTDLEGEAAVFDDPEASLAVLPFLGFCDPDDPIWRNTIELLHSEANPFWLGDRPFPGMASRSRPDQASLAGLSFDLLGPRGKDALSVLERLEFDAGVASATYDVDRGEPASGRYHPGVAGLLAWTLHHALEG